MTDINKRLFVRQLEALAMTMEEHTKPYSFDMDTYYRISVFNTCGYVACICGEQAISGRLEFFPIAEDRAKSDKEVAYIAGSIDDELMVTCLKATNNRSLAHSITAISMEGRKRDAITSNLLTHDQLQHTHLNTDSNPKQAASYIRMLIDILIAKG
jgi:hypothetical protein